MIDGYSVQDAASVLGVPEGRVWELLARGVLFGTPDGDSVRVFLKAQPGPITPAGGAARDEPPRTNGNRGSQGSGGEASAFRELLTEFRNLTERYGQALLALGEARGEVAGLRSRVELLEARLDLRLPAGRDAAPIAWDAVPAATAPEAEVTPAPVPRAGRRRKARSSPSAVASFAEALARAQDPTIADVGAAGDATPFGSRLTSPAPPPAEIPQETAADRPSAAATEEAIEGDAAASSYRSDVVEPDWFADGDFAWLDVAELEARSTPVAAAPEPEPEPEPEPVAVADAVAISEPPADTDAALAGLDPAVDVPAAEPIAGGEELMWIGDRPATTGTPDQSRSGALSDDQLARLARDEGWDATEVAAIRAMITPSSEPGMQLPGADELDVAMAALDTTPGPVAEAEREWAKPMPGHDEPVAHEEWAFESEPAEPLPPVDQPPRASQRRASDPGWLRSRRGPAATAYRRLRRLFPG